MFGKINNRVFLLTCCFTGIFVVLSAFILIPNVSYAKSSKNMTSEKININTATVDELIQLKRIGPNLAERIIAYREENGPFMKTEDILNVRGIGMKFWEANQDRITVEEKKAKAD